MTWFQVDVGRSRHRKTYQLADLLADGAADLFGTLRPEDWRARAIALLDDFWGHVAEHHPDGDVSAAHPDAVKDAVRTWLEGTRWIHVKDVRELLVESGHIDRLEGGQLVVHDWLEWSGAALVKLSRERRRKQLARAADAGADVSTGKARTRTRKTRHSSRREVKGSEERNTTAGSSGDLQHAGLSDTGNQALRELEASLPTAAMAIAVGYVRASRYPDATVAQIRALAPGGTEERAGVGWEELSRGLLDMAAASRPFAPNILRGFVRGANPNTPTNEHEAFRAGLQAIAKEGR